MSAIGTATFLFDSARVVVPTVLLIPELPRRNAVLVLIERREVHILELKTGTNRYFV